MMVLDGFELSSVLKDRVREAQVVHRVLEIPLAYRGLNLWVAFLSVGWWSGPSSGAASSCKMNIIRDGDHSRGPWCGN